MTGLKDRFPVKSGLRNAHENGSFILIREQSRDFNGYFTAITRKFLPNQPSGSENNLQLTLFIGIRWREFSPEATLSAKNRTTVFAGRGDDGITDRFDFGLA